MSEKNHLTGGITAYREVPVSVTHFPVTGVASQRGGSRYFERVGALTNQMDLEKRWEHVEISNVSKERDQ